LSTNVTPAGNAPDSDNTVANGKSCGVVTVKVPNVPTVNVALPALVIDGASNTVNVNACVSSGSVELAAVIVKG
jgi:hypothetical protein